MGATNRVGSNFNLLAKTFFWLSGLTAAATGTGYLVNQNAIDREKENTAGIERRMDGALSAAEQRFLARLELERRQNEQRLQGLQTELTGIGDLNNRIGNAQAEIVELNNRLGDSERANGDLSQQLQDATAATEELRTQLNSAVTLDNVGRIATTISPSIVNITAGPEDDETKQRIWSGTIIRDLDGKRYLLSCGHGYANVAQLYGAGDPSGGEMRIAGYGGLYNFRLRPTALSNGIMGYAPSRSGDILVIPIPADVNANFDRLETERGIRIGLELGDMTQEFRQGELLVGIGNPAGIPDSLYFGLVINQGQSLYGSVVQPSVANGQPRLNPGFNGGNSGMALADRDGRVRGIAISVLPDHVATGNVNGIKFIKEMLDRFGIPVMNSSERELAERERALAHFMLPTPGNPFAQIASSLAAEIPRPVIQDSIARPLTSFMMPSPLTNRLTLPATLNSGYRNDSTKAKIEQRREFAK